MSKLILSQLILPFCITSLLCVMGLSKFADGRVNFMFQREKINQIIIRTYIIAHSDLDEMFGISFRRHRYLD